MKRKETIWLHVLITAALLLVPNVAHSQSYIKDLQYTDHYSLIRTFNDDKYLLYSHNSENMFFVFNDTDVSADIMMTIDKRIHVNDMEIFDGTVYFCGERYEEDNVTRALLGHFELNGFPYNDVYFDIDSTMTTFKKLDLYHVVQQGITQVHAVMTAVDIDGYGTMVDAFPTSGVSWFFYSFDGKSVDETFDDVVVVEHATYGYVVFSSRNISLLHGNNKYTHTRVWVFDIPTLHNQSVFDYFHNIYEISEKLPSGPVHLEELESWFATATTIGKDTLWVSRYSYSGYDASVLIQVPPVLEVKDIQYNNMNAFCLDVLVTTTTANTVDSYIFPIQEFHFDEIAPMYGHHYPDEDLNSLALISNIDNSYIASGHDAIAQKIRAYKYYFQAWVCSEMCIPGVINHIFDYEQKEMDIYKKGYDKKIPYKEKTEGTKAISIICPNNQ